MIKRNDYMEDLDVVGMVTQKEMLNDWEGRCGINLDCSDFVNKLAVVRR
jgi:hypothetical protein